MSNYNNFLFDSKDWNITSREKEGAVKNKLWLELKKDKSISALFKPDPITGGLFTPKSQIEYESAQIAEKLGVAHVQIEIIELEGQVGTFSFNEKNENNRYKDIFQFAEAQKIEGTEFSNLANFSGISLQTIKQRYPQLEKDTVDMLFLDCLIKNSDRHGKNWEIECDKDGNAIRLYKTFDFDNALDAQPSLDMCAVLYCNEDDRMQSHYKIFEKLTSDYPKQIKNLLDKANDIPDLNDFCKKRLTEMNKIYDKTLISDKTNEAPFIKQNTAHSSQCNTDRYKNTTSKNIECHNGQSGKQNNDFEI